MTPPRAAVLTAVAGAVVVFVLGVLTFGVQATARPDHVPLALVAPAPIAERITAAAGDEVDWRVVSGDGGVKLLGDKEVYGVLELGPGTASATFSGAVNPAGTQFAQQVFIGVAQAIGVPLKTTTLRPASPAGRTAPLAASALLWIGGMVAGVLFVVLKVRRYQLFSALSVAVLSVGAVIGLLRWWDSSLSISAEVVYYLLLVAVAFALVQAGLFRFLGVRAMVILAPLYLMAPAVAGQIPELLHPWYRAALWSWTPFRFSTDGLRSLLHGGQAEWLLFAILAAAGLVLVLLPGKKAEPDVADGVVDVGVDEADGLPGTERHHTA